MFFALYLLIQYDKFIYDVYIWFLVDIDECKEPEKYKCEGKCKNIIGDYECKCPLGMHGDGKLGCQGFRVTAIAAGLQVF